MNDRCGMVLAGLILVAACSSEPRTRPETQEQGIDGTDWIAERIVGVPVVSGSKSTLLLDSDGNASGSGGCNGYSAGGEMEGQKLVFGEIASTKQSCTPTLNDQENRFFVALAATRTYQADQGKLLLLGEGGKILMLLGGQAPLDPELDTTLPNDLEMEENVEDIEVQEDIQEDELSD